MTVRTMTTAGWLAMFSAFASLPAAYLSWKLEGRIDATATVIQTAIQLAGILLFVAITLLLRKLLNTCFRFHATDRNIDLLIKLNVTAASLTVLSLWVTPSKETIGIAVVILMITQGVVQVRFGYNLLKLPDNLGGMLKPFCYANMATGIMVASIILLLVGIVVSAIADLMLGTIFLHFARLAREEAASGATRE